MYIRKNTISNDQSHSNKGNGERNHKVKAIYQDNKKVIPAKCQNSQNNFKQWDNYSVNKAGPSHYILSWSFASWIWLSVYNIYYWNC